MNTSNQVSQIVAADLSAYSHVAVKLTSTGINLCTAVTDRVIGTLLQGNNAPQTGGSAVGMACTVNLINGAGLHYVTLGAGITTAIAMGDELQLDTTDGTYCLRTSGEVAAIAWEAAPSSSATGIIRALLLPKSAVARPVASYTADGAIALTTGVHLVAKASAAAMTLAAPSGQDGLTLTIIANTDFAHVITFTGTTLLDGTTGANSTATTAAFIGSGLTVVAVGTKWLLQSAVVCTIAP